MNQKGDESFSFLLGENSGIHQEAKQTPRHGASDRAGPQAPSADEDLTLGALVPSPERPVLRFCFYFYTRTDWLLY